MNLLLVSRDKKFIARLEKVCAGEHTLMSIPSVGWLVNKKRVPEVPHLVLLDISGLEPDKWPRICTNLRKIFDLKVVVVDRRSYWQRARAAFDYYAVGYLPKATRTTKATIKKTIAKALRAGLPRME